MENLPVKLLSELLTGDDIAIVENVVCTHEVGFCPIGISLPEESRVALMLHSSNKKISEFRYTPRAFFAVKVWETARNNLLKCPDFAKALEVEWYPVAASFRSIRFVNGNEEKFVAAMWLEMEKVANSGTIEIHYGRFDAPALLKRPDYPRRYYIIPQQLLTENRTRQLEDEVNSMQGVPAGDFSWQDIADAFVVLKPIQLAFIAGDEMNRCTPLDEEFLDACAKFDLEKVRELVAKGANIHATGKYGDTAMEGMILDYYERYEEDNEASSLKNRARFMELAQYLLSLGYNINLAGYADSTCLGNATHIADMEIIKFLLENGADPNINSYVGDYGHMSGDTVLCHVWDNACCDEENYDELELLLLSYGALPVGKTEIFAGAIKQREERLKGNVPSLIECAKGHFFYYLALRVQCGDDVNVRDERGRNLLQIALEDASYEEKLQPYLRVNLAKMTLMLLCGLKLKLTEAEIEEAKAICREKEYSEALNAITIAEEKTR